MHCKESALVDMRWIAILWTNVQKDMLYWR